MNDIIRCDPAKDSLRGLFDHDNLQHNYQKLDSHYQSKLSIEELDDRHFIHEEQKSYTPIKLTPFARQGVANKRRETPLSSQGSDGQRKLNSRRQLNYEHVAVENMNMKAKLTEVKSSYPSAVGCSPYSVKAFTPATPMTLAMEMSNWLSEHVRKLTLDENGRPQVLGRFLSHCREGTGEQMDAWVDSWADTVMQELKKREQSKLKDTLLRKDNTMRKFYLRVMDEML